MTLEEMKDRINEWCDNYRGTIESACAGCPLEKTDEDWCAEYGYHDNGEELLKKHYEILFGNEKTEEKNMAETKKVLTADQKIEILRQMSADASEWAITGETRDGYWQGVAYMMSSVLEMGNETD